VDDMQKSERPKHPRPKAEHRIPRDYWFPGLWPSAPHPELGGNPRDVDKLHAELGGLTYRWSALARATGDAHLVFFSDFLWLVLTAWSQLPFGDSDRKLRKVREKTRTYLAAHAPEAWRTDHVATGVVFDCVAGRLELREFGPRAQGGRERRSEDAQRVKARCWSTEPSDDRDAGRETVRLTTGSVVPSSCTSRATGRGIASLRGVRVACVRAGVFPLLAMRPG
jgi:hypothetical protein